MKKQKEKRASWLRNKIIRERVVVQFRHGLWSDRSAGTAGLRALTLRSEESDKGNVDHDDTEENHHSLAPRFRLFLDVIAKDEAEFKHATELARIHSRHAKNISLREVRCR